MSGDVFRSDDGDDVIGIDGGDDVRETNPNPGPSYPGGGGGDPILWSKWDSLLPLCPHYPQRQHSHHPIYSPATLKDADMGLNEPGKHFGDT